MYVSFTLMYCNIAWRLQVVRAAEAQGWDEQAVVDNVHNSPTFQLLVGE